MLKHRPSWKPANTTVVLKEQCHENKLIFKTSGGSFGFNNQPENEKKTVISSLFRLEAQKLVFFRATVPLNQLSLPRGKRTSWFRPVSLAQLLGLVQEHPGAKVRAYVSSDIDV